MKQKNFFLAVLVNISALVNAQANTFPTSGNVGIGTSNPQSTLDVNGVIKAKSLQLNDWNNYSGLETFISSENSIPNAPTNDFCYGIRTKFHRDENNYYTDIVTSLYNDRLFFRRHTENGFGIWNELVSKKDMSIAFNATTQGNNINWNTLNFNLNNALEISPIHIPNYTGHVNQPFTNYGQMLTFSGMQSLFPVQLAFQNDNGEIRYRCAYRYNNPFSFGDQEWSNLVITGKGSSGEGITGCLPKWSARGILGNSALYEATGNVGIGTTKPDQKLTVKGKIHAEEVIVDLAVPVADYVFSKDYSLMPLHKVEQYVKTNSHLPDIPSADEVKQQGLGMGEMQNKLLQKIEELTLYVIQQQKEIQALKERIGTSPNPSEGGE